MSAKCYQLIRTRVLLTPLTRLNYVVKLVDLFHTTILLISLSLGQQRINAKFNVKN